MAKEFAIGAASVRGLPTIRDARRSVVEEAVAKSVRAVGHEELERHVSRKVNCGENPRFGFGNEYWLGPF